MSSPVLVRIALTGIYLVHGIPRDVQRAARPCAAGEGTTLGRVLLQALREYAAGHVEAEPLTRAPEGRPIQR